MPFGDTAKHVTGMSNIFQSTKTLGSIGFMGFGFKTVYKRFTRVDISDTCGWKFYYDVGYDAFILFPRSLTCDSEKEIKLTETMSIYSRNWLGTVIPKWDNAIQPPESGFTTKFTMRNVPNENMSIPLVDDFIDMLADDNIGVAILSLMVML